MSKASKIHRLDPERLAKAYKEYYEAVALDYNCPRGLCIHKRGDPGCQRTQEAKCLDALKQEEVP